MFKKISLIMFVLKDFDLVKSIESILNQSFKDFELIIIDSQNSAESIRDFIINNDKIRYFKSDEKAIAVGFNSGLALSKGEYVLFLTNSDYLYPNSLKELILRKKDLVYGTVKVRGSYINHYGKVLLDSTIDPKINPTHLSSALIKKEIFNDIGAFNSDLLYNYDLDFWLRLAKATKNIEKIENVIAEVDWAKNTSEKIIQKNKYPLQNYWLDRKSVSFSECNFVSTFNNRNYPWIAVKNFSDTDLIITENIEIENNLIYRTKTIDINLEIIEKSKAILANFPVNTTLPFFLLEKRLVF